MNDNSSDIQLLLEIGTEEIPAGFLSDGVARIKELVSGQLKAAAVVFSEVRVYATPRRIAIIADGVREFQESKVREVFGPPVSAAYDADGNPTRAALGFAATNGVDVGKLSRQTKGKGSYIVARIEENGLPVSEIAAGLFEKIIAAIRFPKMMRWASLDCKFARPICWITALCGGQPVSLKYGGVESTNMTYGHRFLSEGAIKVVAINDYIAALKSNYVILDQNERKDVIRKQAAEIAKEYNASPVNDDALLETVTYIVEYPVCVAASFPEEFLKLPPELLISVMRGHQKYFALERDGDLINQFIVVSNTLKENETIVRAGAERVIKARLEDAKFYYEQDLQVKLIDRIESLKGITFHDKLGSLYDKTKRLEKIIDYLAEVLQYKPDKPILAASLSKTSLATGVVREFPELQGVMGKHYAIKDGYDDGVAKALNEQYINVKSQGECPKTDVGMALSIADKLDNIVSFFSVGLIPTGSEDPFALRRQAIGLMWILLLLKKVTLKELFDKTITLLGKDPGLIASIEVFFRARLGGDILSQFNVNSKGRHFANDEVQAALDGFMELSMMNIIVRTSMLNDLKNSDGCNEFLFAFKRIQNIVPDGIKDAPNPDLFVTNEEKELYENVKQIQPPFDKDISQGLYQPAYEQISTLITPINNFFDKVLVMDKDERQRSNKLALLNEIRRMSVKLADVSKLQER
ncbi:MAG: glycine--tRNA ligase subunit beta [Nitrospirae bacterium]|nr:glycine--tRNA ligase subunit beta [Nitrospirota bacterium]